MERQYKLLHNKVLALFSPSESQGTKLAIHIEAKLMNLSLCQRLRYFCTFWSSSFYNLFLQLFCSGHFTSIHGFLLQIFFPFKWFYLTFFSTTFWRTWVSVHTTSIHQGTTSVQEEDIALLVQFLGGFWREIVDWFTQHHFYWSYNSRVRQIWSKDLKSCVLKLRKNWKMTR